MKLLAIASFALLFLKATEAYNPYLTTTTLRCSEVLVGSDYEQFTDYINITDLNNNIPQNGEIIRSKVCFKGPSSLIVELSNSTTDPKYTLTGVISGSGNTESSFYFNEDDTDTCGQEQIRPPIFSTDWYTCNFLVLYNHVADTNGTCYIEARGLEPVLISCTDVEDPDQLQYIRFGTDVQEVEEALILYDCPIGLDTVCSSEVDLSLLVNVTQSQSARSA